ncbi:MAG TPA: sigma 54-interacting transcriptional regulator [Thermoanaerobaculia bacterium]|nr:sigma 54-interacting transcriptional regulator [Thermoanaerobaculia bacterium]
MTAALAAGSKSIRSSERREHQVNFYQIMSASQTDGHRVQNASTVVSETGVKSALDLRVPALTILAHPVTARVGERVLLPALISGRSVPLSRHAPLFAQPGSSETRPLEDLHLSRQPISLVSGEQAGWVHIVATPESSRIESFGVSSQDELGPADLERGVPLLLGGRVALLLHILPAAELRHLDRYDLIGDGAAVVELRAAIRRAAALAAPVLLRGETGTGKELVARAIHQASPRRSGPYLTLNLGAVPVSLAASELFGAARGSFTGADRRREGYFERADGGTLFLDEVGEASPEVQALLLRTLENGEIQPVGADAPRRVDVRVVAATDADLERLVADGRFRAPLLHRLQGDQIRLPPLRVRRDDIGRLLIHFLRQELEAVGEAHLLDDPGPGGRPWLPARLVARLAAADWPGNVRELRNVARRLAAGASAAVPAELPPDLESAVFSATGPAAGAELPTPPKEGPPKEEPRPRPRHFRALAEIPEEEVLAVLQAEHFNLTLAAGRLDISRTALYAWVERQPELRKASSLSREEIAAALDRAGGDLDGAADFLGVSRHGLRLRRNALGLG